MVLEGLEVAHTVEGAVVSVAIGCTDSIEDLKRSLWCSSAPWVSGHGRVHSGYLQGGILVADYLRPIVRQGRLRIAGHSLGGAVARLTARLLDGEGICVEWIETYGEPASQGPSMAWLDNLPGVRYRCGSDPIPYWAPGYYHARPARQLQSPHPWFPGREFLDHRLKSYEIAMEE